MKENFIINVTDGDFIGLGEVAWNPRYGESKEQILSAFNDFQNIILHQQVETVESLTKVFDEMDELPLSLRSGIESAFIHYLGVLTDQPVTKVLELNTRRLTATSFSLPIMEPGKLEEFYLRHNLSRFSSLKLKIDADSGYDLVKTMSKIHRGTLRLDANEGFSSIRQYMRFTEKVKSFMNIEFMEQPLPASYHDEYVTLKKESPLPLIADESITNQRVTDYYTERFHGVNIKLMKSGGYIKAAAQLREAKRLGMKTMLGCMVESSLGILSALHLSDYADYVDLDGSLLLEKDPYGFVSEENGRLFMSELQ